MVILQLQDPAPPPSQPSWALWRLGFRPFYLLAAGFALLAIPLWLWQYSQGTWSSHGLNGMAWHAHEMIFGYAIAVIAGFLLTAVRNWTGVDTPSGWPLACLALLWLGARLLIPFAPLWLGASLDMLFLPCLSITLYRRLRATPSRRNHFIPGLLLVLTALNLCFYLAQASVIAINSVNSLHAALMLITTLEVIIAGRVVPMFTRNAIPSAKQFQVLRIERVIAPATAIMLLANLFPLPALLLAIGNLLLAILHGIRLASWGPQQTYRHPLLWILHLAYLWIPAAFVLYALAALSMVPVIAPIHVLAIGALGGLTIGMITRTALGHSGRQLRAGTAETAAYICISLAAISRLLPFALPMSISYTGSLWLTGVLWCLGFSCYLAKYVPLLNQPRVDGKAG